MDTIFYLFNVNLHFIAMQTSGANAITLHIVQKEQCTPNVFSATHSTLLVVALPLEDSIVPVQYRYSTCTDSAYSSTGSHTVALCYGDSTLLWTKVP